MAKFTQNVILEPKADDGRGQYVDVYIDGVGLVYRIETAIDDDGSACVEVFDYVNEVTIDENNLDIVEVG